MKNKCYYEICWKFVDLFEMIFQIILSPNSFEMIVFRIIINFCISFVVFINEQGHCIDMAPVGKPGKFNIRIDGYSFGKWTSTKKILYWRCSRAQAIGFVFCSQLWLSIFQLCFVKLNSWIYFWRYQTNKCCPFLTFQVQSTSTHKDKRGHQKYSCNLFRP